MGTLPPDYVYREFPKTKYHPDGRAATVVDAGEELALGPAWADRPFPPVVIEAPVSDVAPPVKRRGRPPKERLA
jgi:hypothetical protein